jgi:hypothetical protein
MIGKRTVNTTLAKGHHTQTQHTARNFQFFSHDGSMPIITVHYFFYWGHGEDEYSQVRFPVILYKNSCSKVNSKLQIQNIFHIEKHEKESLAFDMLNACRIHSCKLYVNYQNIPTFKGTAQ